MASKSTINLTARDYDVLSYLIKTPLDARQLLQLSCAFQVPFTHDKRLVRRRLTQLADVGLVQCFQYATTGSGASNYYKPTKLGYRLIEGTKVPMPSRAYFREVSLSLQEHTRSLADFIVQTHTSAYRHGVRIGGFYRENELRLTMGDKTLKPDCAFQVVDTDGTAFNYLVEIDCGTEPIRSTKQRESLEQKIRFYDAHQDKTDKRFRVLVLFTKESMRMQHFCQAAKELVRNPQRTLFYAGLLSAYLEQRCNHQSCFCRPSQSNAIDPSVPAATGQYATTLSKCRSFDGDNGFCLVVFSPVSGSP